MGTAIIKHPVPDLVKHVICNFWRPGTLTLRAERQCPDVNNYKWRLNPVWHRLLYSCTHMSTVGVNQRIKFITNFLNETDRLMTRMYLSTHSRSVSESMISVIVWERGGHRRWSSLMRTIMLRWPWEYCSMTSRTSYGLRACYIQAQHIHSVLE